MLIEEVLTFVKIGLALVDMELKFVLQRGVTGLEQHRIGHGDGIRDFLRFLGDMSLFGQRGQALKLFLFEQADALKITFHHVLLFGGFSDFVVVRRHPCDVVQHLSPFVGGHLGKARHVPLQDDVVSVRAGVGGAQQSVEHFLCAVFTVQLVRCHGVV